MKITHKVKTSDSEIESELWCLRGNEGQIPRSFDKSEMLAIAAYVKEHPEQFE